MSSFASRFGVYVHFPYCLSKCPYCDFASVAATSIPHERYAKAIEAELEVRVREFFPEPKASERKEEPCSSRARESILPTSGGAVDSRQEHGRPATGVESLYFGGGTPSLWEPRCVGAVIRAVDRLFGLAPGCEITLEANPGASDAARFSELRAVGVNRLSIGVQSFHPRILAGLGRRHSGPEAMAAYESARRAGFDNVSLDLIFGGPGQDPLMARADVDEAIRLGPDHLSCYGLTLEGLAEEVRLAKDVKRGRVRVPDDAAQEEMGRLVRDSLAEAGYRRYEISNFSKPGFESRHNTLYWLGREYVAAGCGAHGFLRTDTGGIRYGNPRKPEAWLAAVEAGGPPEVERDEIAPDELFEERIFLGLRLVDGVDLEEAAADTIGALPPGVLEAADELATKGLLVREGSRVRCTDRGFDFHTEVAIRLLPEEPAPAKKRAEPLVVLS
ncbi:MAG TPA: radical SAM family heme chaperone HemW [Vulgatibacter sp.]